MTPISKGGSRMKFSLFFSGIALIISSTFAFDHAYTDYGKLLDTYVCSSNVAYKGLLEEPLVDTIKKKFEPVTASAFDSWSENHQIAFLINAYNFYTVVLILNNYPLETGIRDIRRPWKQKFVPLFGNTVSLDHIEHEILRKEYAEPRIHFAVVCASKGCPELKDTPFTGDNLDKQLAGAALAFLNDPSRNRIMENTLVLSKIFKWYGDDFTEQYG
ncbi:MAG: DUF547 domain-containing protein, partial [Chitinivibrionales bacterium]|nr:DUF547 domain-containing protein [Chitinivibrionales bacterium]